MRNSPGKIKYRSTLEEYKFHSLAYMYIIWRIERAYIVILTLDVDVGCDVGYADLIFGLAYVGAAAGARKRRLEVQNRALGYYLAFSLAIPAILGIRSSCRVAHYRRRYVVHHYVHHLWRDRQAFRWNCQSDDSFFSFYLKKTKIKCTKLDRVCYFHLYIYESACIRARIIRQSQSAKRVNDWCPLVH